KAGFVALALIYKNYLPLQCSNASALTEALLIFFQTDQLKDVHMSTMYVTKETLEQMKVELQQLKGVERPAASRAIAEAREKGDLKENAEYDAAKDAQGLLEAKINRMETELASARILDASTIDTSKVSILTKVTITNKATQKSVTYQIVSEKEADLKMQKISVTSPIGKGLLGKKVGDLAEVVAPNGKMVFTIDHIAV
ncbi:MAG: transcription elongation factor GreA, partial [Bacteroidota bacterium]